MNETTGIALDDDGGAPMTVSQLELTPTFPPVTRSWAAYAAGIALSALVLAVVVAAWFALFWLVPLDFTPPHVG
jgi:hypothetical protein